MSNPVSSAQFLADAQELLASSANWLAADRRSYATILDDRGAGASDTVANLTGVADALDGLAEQLRSS